jgi:hypothetical protein
MVAAPAVIPRASPGDVEGFFYSLRLRRDTPDRGGGLGDRRSRGARRRVKLSGAGRRRRPGRGAVFVLSLDGASGRRRRGVAERWRLLRRGRRT